MEYSEWKVATINKKNLLNDEKLVTAFSLFDEDGGGSISPEEIKGILGIGKEVKPEVWDLIVKEVVSSDDSDEITFDDFKRMMQKLL